MLSPTIWIVALIFGLLFPAPQQVIFSRCFRLPNYVLHGDVSADAVVSVEGVLSSCVRSARLIAYSSGRELSQNTSNRCQDVDSTYLRRLDV